MSGGSPGEAPSLLPRMIDEVARAHPDVVALRHGTTEVTYRELVRRAGRVAAGLRRAGLGSEPVALSMPRGVDLIVGLLGIAWSGAACLPLDADYPEVRRKLMLADSGARAVLTCRAATAHSAGDGPTTLLVEDLVASEDGAAPAVPPHPRQRDPLYLIYTSGSTGTPKGVVMSHGAFGTLVDWHRSADGPQTGVTTLQFAPISFDVSVQEIYSTLCNGGTLLLLDEGQRHDANGLLRLLADERVGRFFVPTVLLPVLAAAAESPLPDLRTVVVLGDQLRVTPAIRDWFARMPWCRLFNHYGPTETHVVTVHELTGPPADWPDLPPIGPPLPHVDAHVLDDEGRPVSPGQPGQLYIGGPGLADGYLGRPDLTDERFAPGPTGARLYRTGDRVRYDGLGALEFLGRTDRQVKIRGHRVELGEVEAALAQHPDVTECAVLTDEDAAGQRRLVAYVVLGGADRADGVFRLFEPSWHAYLADRLPEYMVPQSFVRVAEMPLSPNGKIDRAGLPLVSNDRPTLDTPMVPPATDTERAVAEVWREALRLREVGVLDNFFELGGSSLLVTYVHRALTTTMTTRMGTTLPAVALFEHPTVRSLAARIDAPGADAAPDGRDRRVLRRPDRRTRLLARQDETRRAG